MLRAARQPRQEGKEGLHFAVHTTLHARRPGLIDDDGYDYSAEVRTRARHTPTLY